MYKSFHIEVENKTINKLLQIIWIYVDNLNGNLVADVSQAIIGDFFGKIRFNGRFEK